MAAQRYPSISGILNKAKLNKIAKHVNSLNADYKINFYQLNGFNDTSSGVGCNYLMKPWVITVDNFMNSQECLDFREKCLKECSKNLMKHGNRRHALYFNLKESEENDNFSKKYYKYGKKEWPMNESIPSLISNQLLNKILSQFGLMFNGVVYNVYTSKRSHIFWHTDLQTGIADIVATFTTGRTGYLEFRPLIKSVKRGKEYILQKEKDKDKDKHKENDKEKEKEKEGNENENKETNTTNKDEKKENEKSDEYKEVGNDTVLRVPCHDGTLCIMGPGVNQYYQHRIDCPTQEEIEQSINKFGNINRENLTLHWHFDETKFNNDYSNLIENKTLYNILQCLNQQEFDNCIQSDSLSESGEKSLLSSQLDPPPKKKQRLVKTDC